MVIVEILGGDDRHRQDFCIRDFGYSMAAVFQGAYHVINDDKVSLVFTPSS